MTKALSIVQQIGDFQQVSKLFAESGLFTDTKTASQCFVKVMAGAEMGLPPFTSMNAFHIIQGKVTMAANTIAARIKASGRYNYRTVEKTQTRCTVEFFENGQKTHTETWDVARAQKAGVKNMEKFPDAMLFSRAISAGARVACPDVVGSYYTPEELGADVNEEGEIIGSVAASGAVVDSTATETASTTTPDPAQLRANAVTNWKAKAAEAKALGIDVAGLNLVAKTEDSIDDVNRKATALNEAINAANAAIEDERNKRKAEHAA